MSERKTQDARHKTQDRDTSKSLKSSKSLNVERETTSSPRTRGSSSLESRVLSPESSSIAMIGDRDSILGFKALGVAIFPVITRDESAEALQEVIKQEYRVAFITEQIAPSPEEIKSMIGDRVFPIVTMVPSNRGSTGLAMQKLRALVRKAAGADVL